VLIFKQVFDIDHSHILLQTDVAQKRVHMRLIRKIDYKIVKTLLVTSINKLKNINILEYMN
jgi:hypothetical protein